MKEFSCFICGGKEFTLIKRTYTKVDFSQEGVIEGHPFIRNAGEQFDSIICFNCCEIVPDEQAQEMLKEIK